MDRNVPDGTNVTEIRPDAFRRPPHNLAAEKSLLGAIFVNNRAYEKVGDFLRAEHFVLPEHGRIYAACGILIDRGQIADPVTLKRMFESDGGLQDIGGPAYLAELAESAVTVINAGEYGRLVHDLHLRRQLIAYGQDLMERAWDGDVSVSAEEIVIEAEAGLTRIVEAEGGAGDTPALGAHVDPVLQEVQDAMNGGRGLAGLGTGLADLDRLTGGLQPTDLVILAGATSAGKSALAIGILEHAARRHHETRGEEGGVGLLVSLEMSARQIARRAMAGRTGVGVREMRTGQVGTAEFPALVQAAGEIRGLPFFVEDGAVATLPAIRSRALRLKRRHGLGLLVVDYLQLVQADNRYRGQRVNEVSEITRGLKTLAMELEVPVLALSQLSRQVDQRDDHRPRKSDLRESGSIEQDANLILMVYRAEYYLRQEEPDRSRFDAEDKYWEARARWDSRVEAVTGKGEIIIAKNREGPTGAVEVRWDGLRQRFANLYKERDNQP